MKKTTILLMTIFSFYACSSDDDNQNQPVEDVKEIMLGKWKALNPTNCDAPEIVEFKKDNVAFVEFYEDCKWNTLIDEYQISGQKVTLQVKAGYFGDTYEFTANVTFQNNQMTVKINTEDHLYEKN